MATYQILSWHGIPVQVRAKQKRKRVSVMLPDRFQEAVDRAAMSAGLIGDDAYLDGFTWSKAQARTGTPKSVAEAVAAELDANYPEIAWYEKALALRRMRKQSLDSTEA